MYNPKIGDVVKFTQLVSDEIGIVVSVSNPWMDIALKGNESQKGRGMKYLTMWDKVEYLGKNVFDLIEGM